MRTGASRLRRAFAGVSSIRISIPLLCGRVRGLVSTRSSAGGPGEKERDRATSSEGLGRTDIN